VSELKQHWIAVLDVAVTAVEDAARIHGLPPDESRARLDGLRAERAWLESVDWGTT
jgi:hypothetical protein